MQSLDLSTLQITPEILSLIAEIDEFKGAWRALGRIAPDRLSSLRRVATIESIGSSTRIEGAKLSDREVERLLANLRIGSFSSRDEQEVAGYAEVMETIFSAFDAIPLNEITSASFIGICSRTRLKMSDTGGTGRPFPTMSRLSTRTVGASASSSQQPPRSIRRVAWRNWWPGSRLRRRMGRSTPC